MAACAGGEARRAFRRARAEMGSVNADLQESIAGVREAQAFNREDENIEQFERTNAANRDANVRAAAFTSATTTITVTARSGVAATIGDYIKSLTNAGGTISARRESIDSQQKSLDTRIRLTQERLEKREKDLYAQFARLEVALAKMQSQSSQLSAGLASLGAMTG